jgi:hypothetical protein
MRALFTISQHYFEGDYYYVLSFSYLTSFHCSSASSSSEFWFVVFNTLILPRIHTSISFFVLFCRESEFAQIYCKHIPAPLMFLRKIGLYRDCEIKIGEWRLRYISADLLSCKSM